LAEGAEGDGDGGEGDADDGEDAGADEVAERMSAVDIKGGETSMDCQGRRWGRGGEGGSCEGA